MDSRKVYHKSVLAWSITVAHYRNDKIHSDNFSFRNLKCNLEFHFGDGKATDFSYLVLKSEKKPCSPIVFDVCCICVNKKFCEMQRTMFGCTGDVIWKHRSDEVYGLTNSTLNFRVMYGDPLKGEKSIQTPLYIHSRFMLEGNSKIFSKLLDEGSNHDLEFICGDKTIKAHKNILCCRSDVFTSMLQSDMVEAQTGRINIQDVDTTIFEKFLRYVYTGMLPELTVHIAIQFYECGDKYNINALRRQCSDFLTDNLSPENACDILVVADQHNDLDFKKDVIKYVTEKKIPYTGEKWADFCKENPVLAVEVLNLFCQQFRSKKNS